MTHTRDGDRVTIEMTRDDYNQLTLMLGTALGVVSRKDPGMFWSWLRFINELNRTNPGFVPYPIPEIKL